MPMNSKVANQIRRKLVELAEYDRQVLAAICALRLLPDGDVIPLPGMVTWSMTFQGSTFRAIVTLAHAYSIQDAAAQLYSSNPDIQKFNLRLGDFCMEWHSRNYLGQILLQNYLTTDLAVHQPPPPPPVMKDGHRDHRHGETCSSTEPSPPADCGECDVESSQFSFSPFDIGGGGDTPILGSNTANPPPGSGCCYYNDPVSGNATYGVMTQFDCLQLEPSDYKDQEPCTGRPRA
jgi:hypothetical protein